MTPAALDTFLRLRGLAVTTPKQILILIKLLDREAERQLQILDRLEQIDDAGVKRAVDVLKRAVGA